jgi:hypothetical protein
MAKKIKVKVFDELRESLQDALTFETKRRGGNSRYGPSR